MRLLPSLSRASLLKLSILWGLGVALTWWLLPVGPRDGWQPPKSEFVWCFLQNGRILVTLPRPAIRSRNGEMFLSGPIRLRDVDTGQLVASYLDSRDKLCNVRTFPDLDLLWIEQCVGEPEDHNFRLCLLKAMTGKEVASFACHVPQDNVACSVTANSQIIAYVTGNEVPTVELHDLSTGRLLHEFPGWRQPTISRDARRVAASGATKESKDIIAVWDVSTGRQLATFRDQSPNRLGPFWAREFSPNAELLLDLKGAVWDVGTGKMRMRVPGVNSPNHNLAFTPDNRAVIDVVNSANGSWLAYYDASTGLEQMEGRVCLTTGPQPQMALYRPVGDGRTVFAIGSPRSRAVTSAERLLAKVPGLQRLGNTGDGLVSVMVDVEAGKEILRVNTFACCTPDRRLLICSSGPGGPSQFWDIPPGKSLYRLLLWISGWTVMAALLTWLKGRWGRLRKIVGNLAQFRWKVTANMERNEIRT
jgi:WD40 repeat protein